MEEKVRIIISKNYWKSKKTHSNIIMVTNGNDMLERLFAKLFLQKQPFRGVLRKMCPENAQKTPMSKCDFNKVAKQNHNLAWVLSCRLAVYFQNTFS